MSEERELLLWPDGDLSRRPQRWVRRGECLRCGACCEEGRPSYYTATRADLEGPHARECVVPGYPLVAEAWDGEGHERFWQQGEALDHVCPQYRGDGGCAVHGTCDQPDPCRKFPLFPSEMARYPACGFRFVRVA